MFSCSATLFAEKILILLEEKRCCRTSSSAMTPCVNGSCLNYSNFLEYSLIVLTVIVMLCPFGFSVDFSVKVG